MRRFVGATHKVKGGCVTDYTVIALRLNPPPAERASFLTPWRPTVEKMVRGGGIKPPTKDKELTHHLCQLTVESCHRIITSRCSRAYVKRTKEVLDFRIPFGRETSGLSVGDGTA
jgi:hypothetical protein